MSIKQNGGVFGRNPTFNDVTIEGDLIINGEVFTGLDFQGSWNASTNSPSLASSTGTNGEFYIVSVAGTTNLNGITNWGIGDWAIFNGTAWQRVEGGADGNFDALTANSLTVDGNVDIGTASATSSAKVTIQAQGADGSDETALVLRNYSSAPYSGFVTTEYEVGTTNIAEVSARRINSSNGELIFRTKQSGTITDALNIDSSGRVGIGTSSPQNLLHVNKSDSLASAMQFTNSTTGATSTDGVFVGLGPGEQGYLWHYEAKDLIFGTSNAERLRIDPSGNVLVGTTDTAPATNNVEGIVLRNEGHINVSRASGIVGYFNRKTNDGDIISLHKDGTAVGSIGTDSNSQFIIGAGDTGLTFQSNTDAIIPRNTDGTARTQLINLGTSGAQFKDLYLSGGVYLGGTGTANKLDDYEEGTWTPTAASYDGTMTVNSASYVKVGKLVTVKAKVSFDATSDGSGVSITSLPFATTGAGKANGGFVTSSTVSSAARVQAVGSSSLFLMAADDSNVTYTAMASTSLEFVFIYEAA